jgi:hypothetical protein
MKTVITRLKKGERLRTGYSLTLKAVFDNGDVVSPAVMRRLKKAGAVTQDRDGYVHLAKQ